ncbi:MAG: hypothetical protein SF053_18035 [Bacteroidia bacterium]|nr:hypothetical protein [Bacteroidia bacterium]
MFFRTEYLYLGAAVLALIYLAMEFPKLDARQIGIFLVMIALLSFLYGFRRTQRIKLEQEVAAYEAEQHPEDNPDAHTP